MDRREQLAELRQTWRPPPELAGPTPRDVALTGTGTFLTVLAILLLAGAVGAFLGLNSVAKRELRERLLLREQGVDTQGTVTRLWRSSGKDRTPMVTYMFRYGDVFYQGTARAKLSVWRNLEERTPFRVRFVPDNPALNRPADWEPSIMPRWVPPLIAAILLFNSGLIYWLVGRRRTLLAEGWPAPAIVTRSSFAQHGKKYVYYEFRAPSGDIQKGRYGPVSKPPGPGATVCIVYDPDRPRRNALYPMDIVKLR